MHGFLPGNAENLAAFVYSTVDEFDLVLEKRDEAQQLILRISDSFFAAATDNASAETSSASNVLGVHSSRCQGHSFALSWKYGLVSHQKKRKEKVSVFDLPDGFNSDSGSDDELELAVDPPPGATAQAKDIRVVKLYSDLRDCAKRAKLGKVGSYLLGWQRQDGVSDPLSLVDGNTTRWTNAADVFERACLLERYMKAEETHAGVLPTLLKKWTNEDWITVKQCGALCSYTTQARW